MSQKYVFGWSKSIRTVLQAEASECGPACLAMLLEFYGHATSLRELRETMRSSSRGTALKSLLEAADQFGLQARAIRMECDEAKSLRLPAIIHLDGDHFVVLERVSRSGWVIHDPARGKRRVGRREIDERFTGIAIEILASDRVVPKARANEGTLALVRRLGRLKGFKTSFIAVLTFSAVLEITALFGPLFLQMVVDTVLVSEDVNLLLIVCGCYLFLSVFQTVSTAFRSWAISVLGSSLSVGWITNTFRRLIKQPDRYFEGRSTGDLSSRFGGLSYLQSAVSTEAIAASLDGALEIFTLLVLFIYSKQMALVVCAGCAIYLGIKLLSFRVLADANVDAITQEARKETMFIESIAAQGTLRLNNRQSMQAARFVDRVSNYQRSALRLASVQLVFSSASTLTTSGIRIATIFLGAKLIMNGGLTAGMLIAFLAYCDQFTGRSARLIDYAVNWRILKVHADRVREIVDSPQETNVLRTRLPVPADTTICLEHVGFAYSPTDDPILKYVDFAVRPGDCVALTGQSGSGKSTVVKLLAGTVSPTQGSLLLGGLKYEQLGKARVREIVSFVVQDDELLQGSVEENVSFFDPSLDTELVRDCCEIACVHEDIIKMPMQYQTQLGSGRVSISGGQRQRIMIARALYRRPKVLVLDESTSHLDIQTEARLLTNLRALGLTIILVAHRLETINFADRILYLKDGVLPGRSAPVKVDEEISLPEPIEG